MLSNDFLESKHSYRVSIADMGSFLKECEEEGLMWSHGLKPTEFDPVKFYGGDNIKYLAPIQRIDDRGSLDSKINITICWDGEGGSMKSTYTLDWEDATLDQ